MVADVLADDAVVAGEARRLLRDHAEADRVVVAPGDQRRARRRAQRRRMELRVAQPRVGDAVERRRRDHAAEGARRAEADVVGHDQQHVGRALGRHHARRPLGLGLGGVEIDLAAELRRRVGRYLPSIVVVASGDPGTPLLCWASAEPVAATPAATPTPNWRRVTPFLSAFFPSWRTSPSNHCQPLFERKLQLDPIRDEAAIGFRTHSPCGIHGGFRCKNVGYVLDTVGSGNRVHRA